jgi:ribulose kinase
MTWWEWTIAAVWGPCVGAVAAMLGVVAMGKATDWLARRHPAPVERRQPHRAGLREAIERRGVVKPAPEVAAWDAEEKISA